jgi:hypothetical protein
MPFNHRIEHASRKQIHAAASAQIAALEAEIKKQKYQLTAQRELLQNRNDIIHVLSGSLSRRADEGVTIRAIRVSFRQLRDHFAGAVLDTVEAATLTARWGRSWTQQIAPVINR